MAANNVDFMAPGFLDSSDPLLAGILLGQVNYSGEAAADKAVVVKLNGGYYVIDGESITPVLPD